MARKAKTGKQIRNKRRNRKRAGAGTVAAFIIAALCLGIGIRLFGFTFIYVTSGRMAETLPPGHVVLVSRMAPAERGDIVLANGGFSRVVGMPGDRVGVSEGRLTVNGAALDEPYVIGSAADAAETLLGAGRYLLMADDRSVGGMIVSAETISGVALFIVWPLGGFSFL